jgi:hypothetical protein
VNEFLNENWKEVDKQLSPAINAAIAQIVHNMLIGMTSLIPFDEIFPETLP